MTDFFGGQTNYTYDALGRLTSLANPFGEVATFQYDANSRLIRKNLSNGSYTTYSYNSRGFLLGIANYKSNGTVITYATYTYDAVGNRLSMTTPDGTYSYSYDATYRLTGEVNPVGGTYSYTYDAVGNRLTMTRNGQTTNYTYDAGNKLLQAGNTTFTYDGNGNMVSKTENNQTTTYVYNYEDKMVQVVLPGGGTVNYAYDHEGKRIGKTAGGTTIDYYFDGDDVIIESQGASIVAYYTQGQGLISQRRGNASYFYHYDGLGSTKALTDANQNIQASYKYDAWGNVLQSSGTITNPYLYVGELGYYSDGDSGMYLLTQRWYNPVIGRFLVRDPIRGGENLYNYGNNSVVNLVDPKGLICIPIHKHKKLISPHYIRRATFCWRKMGHSAYWGPPNPSTGEPPGEYGIVIPLPGRGGQGTVLPIIGWCIWICDMPCPHEDYYEEYEVTTAYLCVPRCEGRFILKKTTREKVKRSAAPLAWRCGNYGEVKRTPALTYDYETGGWFCLPPGAYGSK